MVNMLVWMYFDHQKEWLKELRAGVHTESLFALFNQRFGHDGISIHPTGLIFGKG